MVVYEPAPSLADLNPSAPPELQRIVRRCLAKDPEERYQTIKDVAIELKELRRAMVDGVEHEATAPSTPSSTVGGSQIGSPTVSSAAPSSASSAEYIISEIKQHKLAAAIAGLVLIIGGIGLVFYLHARSTEVAIESIAVLPFVNQNHDADSEYLSDGVTESIINSLSQLPNLKVIARSSVFHYKGKESDPLTVGKELGVRAVLTGRITQRGDNITISTELFESPGSRFL
jgi:serine/threonine protein kinase